MSVGVGRVESVGTYVPEKVVTNDDLSKVMNTSDEWIRTRSGIGERRYAAVGQTTSDLAVEASRKAIAGAGLEAKDIDLILASTLSPDYYFPGIGVLIQNKLGARHIPAIDLRGQCAGFTWGLATADAYAKTGQYKKILVVGAEIHSTALDFSDDGRHVAVLFGDGAGAVVVDASTVSEAPSVSNKVSGMIDHLMGTDGSGAGVLAIDRPGMAGQEKYLTAQDVEAKRHHPAMDGKQVFKNAVFRMTDTVNTLLAKHGLSVDDIDLLVPHQANLRINEMIREKLGMPPEKVVNIIEHYGNTTAATIPLCFGAAVEDGRLTEGKLVMTVSFGAGFAWGANLIRW